MSKQSVKWKKWPSKNIWTLTQFACCHPELHQSIFFCRAIFYCYVFQCHIFAQRWYVDGAEFWISSKLSAFPSSFGHLQVIQNSASMWCPNVLWFRQLMQIRWNYPSSFSFLTHKMFNHHSAWINYFARIHWHSRITYEACFCIAGAFIMYLFIFFSRYGIEARKKSEMTRLAL